MNHPCWRKARRLFCVTGSFDTYYLEVSVFLFLLATEVKSLYIDWATLASVEVLPNKSFRIVLP